MNIKRDNLIQSKMKKVHLLFITSIMLLFAFQSVAIAQSSVSETFKDHFNETVQNVNQTDVANEQRSLLNTSFSKMITAVDRLESIAQLSEDEKVQLLSFKNGIEEKQNELNGLDGFNEVQDEDLVDFSEYSQQYFEQANRTVTISVTTALLIIILILLLS